LKAVNAAPLQHREAHAIVRRVESMGSTETGLCARRVAIVTGAGRGIGRSHALSLARQGASVVVNDLDVSVDGRRRGAEHPAAEVVAAIEREGGRALESRHDVSDFAAAKQLVQLAVETWGRLDVLVNNAGPFQNRTIATCTEADWDAVIRGHLKGHFAMTHHAVLHWRERALEEDRLDARLINTTSGAGLLGAVGHSAYAAAKAGITAFTLVAAAELSHLGVTANAIAPVARTRMTERDMAGIPVEPSGFDPLAPDNTSPLVVWLASQDAGDVSGCVFETWGGTITCYEGWRPGPRVERADRWPPEEIGAAVREMLARRGPTPRVLGS
jgi:NAD(P)-dependent dehydrogenase (short-subunit alcohol dehydrogenase family)